MMNRACAVLQADDVRLFTATIKGRCDTRYTLLSSGAVTTAERAAGCLLQPEPGDTVLTVTAEDGSAYILNVLARGAAAVDARITAPGSRMLFEAEQIWIAGGKGLAISAPRLILEAGDTKGSFGTVQTEGSTLESRFLKITSVARTIESVSEVFFQKTGRCYRKVQEFEEATIGRLRMLVDGLFSVSSKSASLKAEKRFKVDAEKIHLG
jgi:hypothetical protein